MENKFEKRLSSLKKKLRKLAKADKEFNIFGSGEPWGGHHYKLSPCLSIQQIRKFELKEKVTIPEEYTSFLTAIGNGGAGPSYGLLSFKEAVNRDRAKNLPKSFSKHFPYSVIEAMSSIAIRQEVLQKKLGDFDRHYLPIEKNGFLFLASHGCEEYSVLIISGEQSGKVWYVYENEMFADFKIMRAKPVQLSFLDWYEKWLDESLKEIS